MEFFTNNLPVTFMKSSAGSSLYKSMAYDKAVSYNIIQTRSDSKIPFS